jgi:hypothetical protein
MKTPNLNFESGKQQLKNSKREAPKQRNNSSKITQETLKISVSAKETL